MTAITRNPVDQLDNLYRHGRISYEQANKADCISEHWRRPAKRNSVYLNWVQTQDAILIIDGVNVSRLQICIDIIIQNHTPNQVAGWYRISTDQVMDELKAALDAYASPVAVAAE